MSRDLIEFFRVEAGSERAERLALTLSYEPMLVWELNGPIEFWNTGAERLYGYANDGPHLVVVGPDRH